MKFDSDLLEQEEIEELLKSEREWRRSAREAREESQMQIDALLNGEDELSQEEIEARLAERAERMNEAERADYEADAPGVDDYGADYGEIDCGGIITVRKKPLEFAQKIVLTAFTFSAGIVLLTLAADFALLWTYRAAMPQETVAAITTYGGVTSGLSFAAYGALTAVRNWSENKYGKAEDGNGSG